MKADTLDLVIYTNTAALEFTVFVTINDFQERLAEALENGTVVLDTTDGTKLVLNAINVAAIEIHEPAAAKQENNPPHTHYFSENI